MYLERLGIFDYSNNFYFKPNGTINSNGPYADIQMPNCTMGAYCRAHEAIEATDKVKGIARNGSTGFGNAKTWIDETGMPTGKELREGSIAVFDGNCGHVVFIERVIDSNHAIYTQSSYNSNKSIRDWQFWSKREAEFTVGKATISGCGKLKGFIYLPINDIRVSRNTKKDQIEITKDLVNVRKGPGLKYSIVSQGLFCPMGIYDCLSMLEADGYTWCKLDDECWVAAGEDWSKIYLTSTSGKEDEKEINKTIKALEKEIEGLKSSYSMMTTKNKELEKELTNINNKNKQVVEVHNQYVDEMSKLL